MDDQPTTKDILDAVNAYATKMDQQFDALKSSIAELRTELGSDMRKLNADTRDFVDRRMADAVAQIAPVARKIDEKDTALVVQLEKTGAVSHHDAVAIQAMSPFAQSRKQ